MVSGRARTFVAAAIALAGCQGRTVPRPGAGGAGSAGSASAGAAGGGGEGTATGGTGGLATAGSAGQGVAAQGGAGQGAAGQTAAAGAGMAGDGSSGASGSAGSGWTTTIPNPSDREKELLAPLGTDDATIDAATGPDLTALAEPIGLARGYAMCRCTFTPNMPGDGFVEDCASAETGLYFLSTPDRKRCIEEEMTREPGVTEYVRCVLKWTRDDGRLWQEQCMETAMGHMGAPWTCAPPPDVAALVEGCLFVTYCADGTRGTGQRCDQVFDCTDQSDELGCFDVTGRDWFWCDGELVSPPDVCRYGTCGIDKEPPVCAAGQTEAYLCNSGGTVPVDEVCDRAFDCEDGSDERYCVK